MTERQARMKTGENFLTLCQYACERLNPPLPPNPTKLQRAAVGLIRFAQFCRDELIDPASALLQALTLQREQPCRTSDDYMREAQANADAAKTG